MLETKIDIKKTALLVIDMQNDLVKNRKEPLSALTEMVESKGVIGNIAKVISAARKVGMPVAFIAAVHRKDATDVIPTITDLMLQGLAPQLREIVVEGTRRHAQPTAHFGQFEPAIPQFGENLQPRLEVGIADRPGCQENKP